MDLNIPSTLLNKVLPANLEQYNFILVPASYTIWFIIDIDIRDVQRFGPWFYSEKTQPDLEAEY